MTLFKLDVDDDFAKSREAVAEAKLNKAIQKELKPE